VSRNPRRVAAQRRIRVGGAPLDLDSPLLEELAAAERATYLRLRVELAPLPPVRERSSRRETPWQNEIVEVATRLGYWSHHPHLSKYSSRGVPDLFLLHEAWGRALWIECKDDHNHLSEFQVDVIQRMRACGLEVHIFRPWHTLEAVAAVLER
jgi:hypothetical protein